MDCLKWMWDNWSLTSILISSCPILIVSNLAKLCRKHARRYSSDVYVSMGFKDSGLNICVVLREIKRSTRMYLCNPFIISSYYHYLYAVNVNYEECVMPLLNLTAILMHQIWNTTKDIRKKKIELKTYNNMCVCVCEIYSSCTVSIGTSTESTEELNDLEYITCKAIITQ